MAINNSSDYQTTQYNILTGGANNLLNNVAPSATSGVPVISQGSSAQPVFGTAVVAGGGTGNTTFTAYSVIAAGTTATGAFQNVSGLGSSGQVLTSNGAGALPTWQNKGWVKITTVTASASSALTITSGITSTYTNYAIVYDNVIVSSNGVVQVQISSDGGSTYKTSGYLSGATNFNYSSTTAANNNLTSGLMLGQTNTAYYTSGCIYLTSMTNGQYPACNGTSTAFNPSTNSIMYLITGGYSTQITVNAIKILNTAGTMTTGDFTLYGLMF